MDNNSDLLGKVLVLPRPQNECLIYQFHWASDGVERYSLNHPTDRLRTAPQFSITTENFFPTVISLDNRFLFTVGGCKDKTYQPGREVVKNNLVLIDQELICLLYTSPSPRDRQKSRMPSSA